MAMTTEEQIADWCIHFNGIQHAQCKAGEVYKSVKSAQGYPCFKSDNCAAQCSHATYPTPEEVTARVEQMQVAIKASVNAYLNGNCPHCGAKIEEKKQVGRCVYAIPCYHRLYQGTLPA
jgi:hypothetical protein